MILRRQTRKQGLHKYIQCAVAMVTDARRKLQNDVSVAWCQHGQARPGPTRPQPGPAPPGPVRLSEWVCGTGSRRFQSLSSYLYTDVACFRLTKRLKSSYYNDFPLFQMNFEEFNFGEFM